MTGVTVGIQVINFRSTEFIADAARDNKATNTLEIADHGFAFGQIVVPAIRRRPNTVTG